MAHAVCVSDDAGDAHVDAAISFGNYTTGEAIDISSMTGAAQIVFPVNVYSMTATLNANNTWTIQQTSMANAALVAARDEREGELDGCEALAFTTATQTLRRAGGARR